MSSEELNRFEYSEEHEQEAADNDQSDKGEKSPKMDGLSGSSNVNAEIKYDDDVDQNEQSQEQQERVKEQPHSDNTHSFKEQFDSAPTFEERRAERRRERRQRRKLTEEEDGPTEGSAQSTLSKFEEGKIDDIHFQKTDTSQYSMASEGTVSLTTAKFKSGNVNVSSEDDDTNKVGKGDGDKSVVEIGTAASRRRALEEYAEEAQKDKGAGDSKNTLEDEGIVLSVGSAASTKAKLERLSSEEKVLEKQVDENAPKRGAASEKRAKFEEKTRQSSEEKDEEAKKPRPAQQASKWPEPKTNYKERRGLRRSASTDEDNVATTAVDKENAKNIEKNKEAEQNGNEEPTGRTDERQRRTSRSTRRQSSTDEEPRSPVRTSEIRNKLVRMLSQEERPPPVDRIGSARPSLGTARNLRARFEAGQVKAEDSHFTGKKPSISARSGYASKVRERFESGEVSRRRYSSTVDEEELVEGDAVVTRRRRTSSARSSEGESVTMSRSAKELRNRFENPPQSTNQQVKRNFVLRSKTASTLSSKFNKSSPVRGPAINKCTTCAKTVYPMEMITADDKPFHRFCFKCTECKATLRLGNYAALQGKIYCKPHFKQLFKVKGNYDEGFGRQQHKKHWEEKGKTEENGENGNDENENDINSDLKSPTESKHEITNGYDDEDTSVNNNARLHDMQDALFEEVDA